MGGEKILSKLPVSSLKGSPPRGRGKALLTECRSSVVGITPAWAGKSDVLEVCTQVSWDHPRVGGEKVTKEEG